jgi:hypothetical protein
MEETLINAEGEAMAAFAGTAYATVLAEDEASFERVQSQIDSLERHIIDTRARLMRLYSPAGYSLTDVLTYSPFIIVYAVKAVRIFFLWSSLTFARALFQARYNDAVYLQNTSPPHPAWFVFLFLGFDLTLNVSLMAFMKMLSFLLKTATNSFPIDGYAMRAIVLDYIMSTTLIAVLAFILAVVVRRKKYFRYRFEGERGIRALSDMILWTSSIILVIPYFRITDA